MTFIKYSVFPPLSSQHPHSEVLMSFAESKPGHLKPTRDTKIILGINQMDDLKGYLRPPTSSTHCKNVSRSLDPKVFPFTISSLHRTSKDISLSSKTTMLHCPKAGKTSTVKQSHGDTTGIVKRSTL